MTLKKISYWIVVPILVAVLLAKYYLYMSTGNQVQGAENFNQAALYQFLFILGTTAFGLILTSAIEGLSKVHRALLSFIVGLMMLEMLSSLLIILHIPFSFVTLGIFAALVLGFAISKIVKNSKEHMLFKNILDEHGRQAGFWLLVTTLIAAFLCFVPISILTFDSVEYWNLGKIYVTEHYFVDYVTYQVSGHSFVPTLINSFAVMFRFNLAYAVQNTFLVSCTLLFGYLLLQQTKAYGFTNKTALWMSIAATAVLAINFFYIYLGITLLPNIFAAYTLFFAVVYMYRYSTNRCNGELILSFLFMVAFCFTRVEGPLIAAFIMVYFAHKNIDTKHLLTYTLGLFGILTLWYISFYFHSVEGFKSAFLTVGRSLFVSGVYLLTCVYIYLKDKYFKKYNTLLYWLFMLGVLALVVGTGVLDTAKFTTNITVMIKNMFFLGFWKLTWFILIGFAIAALLMTKKKSTFLEMIIPLFLMVMFAVFAFRETSLHVNWSDSGNRMLMHIYPLIVFVLADNIFSYFAPKVLKE